MMKRSIFKCTNCTTVLYINHAENISEDIVPFCANIQCIGEAVLATEDEICKNCNSLLREDEDHYFYDVWMCKIEKKEAE